MVKESQINLQTFDMHHTALTELVEMHSSASLSPPVMAIVDAVREDVGPAAKAVLAYGSCLRGVELSDSLVDLYVLVDSYSNMQTRGLSKLMNALIPPNVYYCEVVHQTGTIRAKYAVVSLDQFVRRVSATTRNPYFWARFAQPSVIAFAEDEGIRDRVLQALVQSVVTFLERTQTVSKDSSQPERIWIDGFMETYASELRSEDISRASHLYESNRSFYEHALAAVNATIPSAPRSNLQRRLMRWEGKLLSVARLIKASFTFSGGADYLAWKIARHSGVTVELTPWQKRHPVLAAIVLFPRLYARGAFR